MAKAYSKDLRQRVIAAVGEEGLSRRKAAARFKVGVTTIFRWIIQHRREEHSRLLEMRSDEERRRAQGPLEPFLNSVFGPYFPPTMDEINRSWEERGHVLGNSDELRPLRRSERKSKGYPVELRIRVVKAIEAGSTRVEAAERFGVSEVSAGRWYKRYLIEGNVEPYAMGGDRRSGRAKAFAGTITGWIDELPTLTIAEIQERLVLQGVDLSYGVIWRLLVREGYTVKKLTVFASEQNRKDVKIARREWRKSQKALSKFSLVFFDEFSVTTKMARTVGRALRGKRCVAHVPHGHWKRFTVVAALGPDGIIEFMIFDGAMNAERCRIWMEKLAKKLGPRNLVICDNLAAHKVTGISEILEKKGADIRYLPAYSPDFNPIEKAIAQLKSHLKKVEARTVENLNAAVKEAVNRVTAAHARNHFKSCGYEIPEAT